jgi:hypothetical protein
MRIFETVIKTIAKTIIAIKEFPVVIENDDGIRVVAATKTKAVEKYLEAIKASK